MASAAVNTTMGLLGCRQDLYLPDDYVEPRWYAVSTFANHEKRVADQLRGRAVEHFLPLYGSVRRWNDRRVQLEMPLFPGYVFVHLALRDRLRVLEIPRVARLEGFGGPPVALPDIGMEAMPIGPAGRLPAGPQPYLTAGARLRVVSGPLAGLE